MSKTNGAGSIYQRGNIWWVQVYIDGKPVIRSSKSSKKADAVKLRNQLLAKKERGELPGGAPEKVLIGELLDDVLKSDIKESTRYIWGKVVEKNIRPFFGKLRARRLSTDHMDQYREKRKAEGRSDATVNRELSILRTAFHNARKRTPPKVHITPYFPMVQETTVRKGFLSDQQYAALRDALAEELKALFITGYITGIRKGELLAVTWPQVDFEGRLITLEYGETKNQEARSVPIISGDMFNALTTAKQKRDECWPQSPWVFSRRGEVIKDFRWAWEEACKAAGVPDLNFHDLRRTAVRNMRRAGIPQVIRMKISGHKTDSMERRYNIVDAEDLANARDLLERRPVSVESGSPVKPEEKRGKKGEQPEP
ncbi:MAG TPA: site-specific integrase [Bryobacteraceae bacterium]|jgi:integrase|nr:site-specific integrase [Bryobacteraceae bacterium]